MGKKRGLLIICIILFVLFTTIAHASGCANPAEPSLYCIGDVDMIDCCPTTASYYGEDGAPTSQSDCQTKYYSYSDSTVGGLCSDIGCCYINSEITCDTNSLENTCLYDQGVWNTNGCSAVSQCTSGCCIYYSGTGTAMTSVISSSGYCSESVGGTFDSTITSASSCSALAATYTAADIECNDGIDNDADGDTDYPLDADCISATDASEASTGMACNDGIDNDGDGTTDTADAGCCGSFDTSSEKLCELTACGTGQITSSCNCYSDADGIAEEDGTVCESENYCCNGICQTDFCGECIAGQQQYCGQDSATYCLMYQTCQADETWGTCAITSTCGAAPEVCDDSNDNDGDGLNNCDDLDCYETQCGTTTDTSACSSDEGNKGFYYGGAYVCCSTTDVNDCNTDGTYETCGSCYCTTEPTNPTIDNIIFTRGSAQLTLTWSLECPVEFDLLRCTGSDCVTDTSSMSKTEIQTAFPEIIGANIADAQSYIDTTIGVNQRYCYVVQAIYPDGTNMYSDPLCVEDSGDYWCQELDTNQFCLDAFGGMDESLIDIYGCTDENQVSYIQGCNADYGANYICTGPYSDGNAQCTYQSNCATCGDPLGLYATLTAGFADYLSTETYCYEIPMCYYDYTLTTIDTYQECAYVNSCYNYASQSACSEQYNDYGHNNKCLQRDCEWDEFTSGDGISNGICKEKNADYSRCDACNNAVHNGIFDACTETRCQEFGVDDATCYLSGLTNMCTDISQFTCTAYEDAGSCRGDHNVGISTEDNSISLRSEDALDLGLCYWNGAQCYKDANGDGLEDDGQEDMTPPSTIILTSEKMRSINITLLARDLNEDGSTGDGVRATYYCITHDGTSCYPDEQVTLSSSGIGIIEAGDGSGIYDLYYYSIDNAENLEIIQHYSFDVDKQAPIITITPYVTPDTSYPYDASALTFDIAVNEEAYCTDIFETSESKINNIFNDHFVTKFTELTDGYYVYSVNCTDILGNEGTAFVTAHIDVDTAIFDTMPSGYVDTTSVTLSVKTLQDAECGLSAATEEESFEAMDYGFERTTASGYYYFTYETTLSTNGVYWYDVKCQLADGTTHDDEIQFIYDTTAPSTAIVDSFGDTFDFASFYTGDDLDMYLLCTDAPQYGLGCNATYYCLDTVSCTPTTLYDFTQAIPITDSSRSEFCYYSVENTVLNVGGLSETIHCTEIKVDSYTPSLTITSPSDSTTVYLPYVTVTGAVTDPDATTGAINTATVTVVNTEGSKTTYTVDASNGFSITVPLTLENNQSTYNYITVYGTDRSGATTASQTRGVRYTTELGDDAIWIVSPANGVSTTSSFEFTVGTYLEADHCGYSKNNAALDKSIPLYADSSDSSGYYYSASYSIDPSKEGIGEYVYVKCLLENDVEYSTQFIIEYDTTAPVIESLELLNSDGKTPASIVEAPLDAEIQITTDDRTKCKYSFDSNDGFNTGMTKFTDYDDAEYSTINNETIESLSDNTPYTLYAACQNGAYLTSSTSTLSFTVNTSAASDIYLISPTASGSRTLTITIGTTRTASSCSYGTSSDAITKSMTAVSDKQFKTTNTSVSADGNYTFYFSCWFVDGEKTNYFTIPIDTTAPVIDFIEDGNVSYSNTTLSATWSASDSLTEIVLYQYSIGDKTGYNNTYNWTNTTEKEAIAEDLLLKNQSTYYWNVKAINSVGLIGSASSNGVFIDASGSGTSCKNCTTVGEIDYHPCSNSIKDDDETDIDCGGSCDTCKAGDSCLADTDCTSMNCANNICQESSCEDSIQNQGESDIDCGGNYCNACEEGRACVYHRDCASGYCESKFCAAPTCNDGVKDGTETGVDCGGSCDDCEEVVYQQSPPNEKSTTTEGMSWWVWTLIFLLFVCAGVGGYYGYVYYMKKKGKTPFTFGSLGLGKQLPSFNTLAKFPQKIHMPVLQKQQFQKAQQQKLEQRGRIFKVFEETPTKTAEKIPEKTTSMEKTAAAKKKEKLGEKIVIKKPVQKESSQAFKKLENLIKAKK